LVICRSRVGLTDKKGQNNVLAWGFWLPG